MKNLLFFSLVFFATIAWAQPDTSLVKFVNPATVSTPTGYSHASIIDLGTCKMVMISGQVALDSKGNLVGKDNFEQQAEQVFKNIKSIVTEAGGTMDHVVKTGIFLLDTSNIPAFRSVRNKYFNLKNPPASTLVQVSKLVRDEWLIEIEAVAIIPTTN